MIVFVSAIVFVMVIGARRCRTWPPLTDAQRAQARIDIYIGCQIHDCTPAELRSQLNQLDAHPSVAEEPQR